MTDTRRNVGWLYWRNKIDPADINAIGAAIRTICDDVHLYAIDKKVPNTNKLKNIIKSPCVFFSQDSNGKIRTPRGRIFISDSIPKPRQADIYRQNGILHPRSAVYQPNRVYSEDEFGPMVIVKPVQSSRGRGIFAMETRLIEKYRERLTKHAEDTQSPIMIQRYIDTGDHIAKYRVLLLFGAVMYALKRWSIDKRPINLQTEFITDQFIQSHGVKKDTAFCHESDILETAQKVAAALPEVPILGIDLVREAGTDDVYVIESNIGNTWHLSSQSGEGTRRNVGGRGVLEKEFDTWNVAARRLIEVAREHAT